MLKRGISRRIFALALMGSALAFVASSCTIDAGTLKEESAGGATISLGGEGSQETAPGGVVNSKTGPGGTESQGGLRCTSNQTRCSDDKNLQACTAIGEWAGSEECPYLCRAGACVGSCMPTDTKCSNNRDLATCTNDGVWKVEGCASACVKGQCTGDCVPTSRRCVDAEGGLVSDGSHQQVCSESGEWGDAIDCPGKCSSLASCVNCEDGVENECLVDGGAHLALICSENKWKSEDCPFICRAGACSGSCEPGSSRCSEGGQPEACGSDGNWAADDECTGEQVCVGAGACLAPPVIFTLTSDTAVAHPPDPSPHAPADLVLLQWSLGGGEPYTISIDPDIGTALGTSARSVAFTPSRSANYTLSVSNEAGTSTRSVTVNMTPLGLLNRVHSFGWEAVPVSLALSPSGRVVTLSRSAGAFTMGPVNIYPGDNYVAEHDLEEGSVLNTQIPQYVLYGFDMIFGGEDLYLTGIDRHWNTSPTNPSSIVVGRMDSALQTVDHVTYLVGPGNAKQEGRLLKFAPDGRLFVVGYSSSHVYSSLVALDGDLNPTRNELNEVVGFHENGREWKDFSIDEAGTAAALSAYPHAKMDVFLSLDTDTPFALELSTPSGAHLQRMAVLASDRRILVGHVGDQGYLALVNSLVFPPQMGIGFPQSLADAPYDSLKFVDVCVNDESELIVVGEVTTDGQTDVIVHAFTTNGDSLTEKWKTPLIWGTPEANERAHKVVCDPRGYALVLGVKDEIPVILQVR